jgi:6,7-dimethyl-8-ribityllumazine synthase
MASRTQAPFSDCGAIIMIKEIKGAISAGKAKYAIVVSRFNEFITGKLLAGAIDSLQRHGASDEQITVVWVPGSIEIAIAAKKLAESGQYGAVICLGAVIRGQTGHYDYVCQQVSRGVGQINMDTGVPTIFGVLTCETIEQAIERAGTKLGNSGASAAMGAMEMVNVLEQM